MKRVKTQPIKGTYSKTGYWDHASNHRRWKRDQHTSERNEINENPRANPDCLDQAMSMYEINESDKEVQGRVRKIIDIAKQILTQQQYNVFILLAVKDPALTEREAAKALSLSRGRVSHLWKVARVKLQTAYEKRTLE